MVRPTLDRLPDIQLPDGYSLRSFEPGDEARWCQILGASSGMGNWDDAGAVERLRSKHGPFGDMRQRSNNKGIDGRFEPENLLFVVDQNGEPTTSLALMGGPLSHLCTTL
jgi:hypothetical protein